LLLYVQVVPQPCESAYKPKHTHPNSNGQHGAECTTAVDSNVSEAAGEQALLWREEYNLRIQKL
jgi:hypothetical protein